MSSGSINSQSAFLGPKTFHAVCCRSIPVQELGKFSFNPLPSIPLSQNNPHNSPVNGLATASGHRHHRRGRSPMPVQPRYHASTQWLRRAAMLPLVERTDCRARSKACHATTWARYGAVRRGLAMPEAGWPCAALPSKPAAAPSPIPSCTFHFHLATAEDEADAYAV